MNALLALTPYTWRVLCSTYNSGAMAQSFFLCTNAALFGTNADRELALADIGMLVWQQGGSHRVTQVSEAGNTNAKLRQRSSLWCAGQAWVTGLWECASLAAAATAPASRALAPRLAAVVATMARAQGFVASALQVLQEGHNAHAGDAVAMSLLGTLQHVAGEGVYALGLFVVTQAVSCTR